MLNLATIVFVLFHDISHFFHTYFTKIHTDLYECGRTI